MVGVISLFFVLVVTANSKKIMRMCVLPKKNLRYKPVRFI